MTDTPSADELQRQIAALEAQLRAVQNIAPSSSDLQPASTSVSFSVNGRNYGQQVAVNLGTMIYGRDPREDEQRQLIWYLDTLSARLNQLPLQGLTTKLDQTGEGVTLSGVYVMLATKSTALMQAIPASAYQREWFFDASDEIRQDYHRDWQLPIKAIQSVSDTGGGGYRNASDVRFYNVYRSQLAMEAVQKHQRLVLLGDPGSGKSTFLRYLAWSLAQRELGHLVHDANIPQIRQAKLPVILSLRKLAYALAAGSTVFDALRDEIEAYHLNDVATFLHEALHTGAALLLFDGLDEVPIENQPGVHIDRITALQAIRDIARLYTRTPFVITCRVRAFDPELHRILGWQVEELAPFTLGQVRHFVQAWYNELVAKGHLEHRRAAPLAEMLIQAIVERSRLREMAETPLLLTIWTFAKSG